MKERKKFSKEEKVRNGIFAVNGEVKNGGYFWDELLRNLSQWVRLS